MFVAHLYRTRSKCCAYQQMFACVIDCQTDAASLVMHTAVSLFYFQFLFCLSLSAVHMLPAVLIENAISQVERHQRHFGTARKCVSLEFGLKFTRGNYAGNT